MPLPCKPAKFRTIIQLCLNWQSTEGQLFFSKFGLGTHVNTLRYKNLYNLKKNELLF